jgi:predicted metal-binding protein
MDIREYTSPTLPVAQFVERYVDTDHYDAGCRGCDNYGQVWVCPPYDFSVPDYWGGFREVCLRGVQLRFSPEEQARSYDPEELAERLRQLFSRTARQMILRLREEYPRSDILTVGGCHLCERCTRPEGRPCRYPEGIGYTLESLGCDVSTAAEQLLGASVEPEGMPAGVYGAGLRRADTVRDGLAMIAAEGKNKVRKRLVSGL